MSNDGPVYGSNPPPITPGNQPAPPGFSPDQAVSDAKGFMGALFDFSFTHFVTPKIVKVVYVLATIGLVLGWLVLTLSMFVQSPGVGFAFLLIGPIFLLLYLAVIRMSLEFYVALVRMSEDIHHRLPRG